MLDQDLDPDEHQDEAAEQFHPPIQPAPDFFPDINPQQRQAECRQADDERRPDDRDQQDRYQVQIRSWVRGPTADFFLRRI